MNAAAFIERRAAGPSEPVYTDGFFYREVETGANKSRRTF